jgi:hypothetical protein
MIRFNNLLTTNFDITLVVFLCSNLLDKTEI